MVQETLLATVDEGGMKCSVVGVRFESVALSLRGV